MTNSHTRSSGSRPIPFIIFALLLILGCTAAAPLIYLALFALGHILKFLGGY